MKYLNYKLSGGFYLFSEEGMQAWMKLVVPSDIISDTTNQKIQKMKKRFKKVLIFS
jgi:hypothetical protein